MEKEIDKQIEEHLREVVKLCKKQGILGTNTNVGKYYVSFSFRLKNKYCKKCGNVI